MQVSVAESQRDEALAQLKEYKAEVSVLSRIPDIQLIVSIKNNCILSDGNQASSNCRASRVSDAVRT